jgi:hypothetical protein
MENQVYNQSNGESYHSFKNTSVVSIGDWIITMILMMIPVVNLVMLFVWAFSSGTPVSKANWAKATLIFYLIGIILLALFWGSIAAIIFGTVLGR